MTKIRRKSHDLISHNKKLLRNIVLFIIILSALAYIIQHLIDIAAFKNYVNSSGMWAPFLLLIIIIITSSIGLVFTIPVAISALILNPYPAFVISILGLTIGASISFLVARKFGRRYVEKKYIDKHLVLKRYDYHLRKKGFLTIFYLRLISLIPYELINILAGLSRIAFAPYFFGTLLGIIPGIVLMILVVKNTNDVTSIQFFLSAIMLTLFSLIPLLSKKLRKIIFNLS